MALGDRECPRCSHDRNERVQLEAEQAEGPKGQVEVDVCPTCRGVFLDQGEVETITGHAELDELLTDYLGIDSDSPLVCPSCGGVMDAEDAAGVELDVCLDCHGVWADADEIEELLDKDPDEFLDFDDAKEAELYDQRKAKRSGAIRSLRDTLKFWKR